MSIPIQLSLVYITFYTIEKNWYTGKYPIYELEFATCEISEIKSNAFAETAFQNLTILTFYDKYTRIYDNQAYFLNGLDALKSLTIHRVLFHAAKTDIFRILKKQLEKLILINATVSAIFVNEPFVRLQQLIIKNTRTPLLKRITAKTFGQLPAIVVLELDNCGVELIEIGAFAQMPATLNTILLRSNQLQTLPTNLFNRFGMKLFLGLDDNPWACQCFILELNDLYNFLSSDFHRRCNRKRCRTTVNELNFDLGKERSCIYHPGTVSLFTTYPKFAIKFEDHVKNVAHIDGQTWPNTTKIFVLILKSTPFENELESICFVCQMEMAPFLIAMHDLPLQSDQPQILHVLNGVTRVWLLNIASMQPRQLENVWLRKNEMMCVLLMLLAALLLAFGFGFALGFSLFCCFPILLSNLDRVVVLPNRNAGNYRRKTQIFIMPRSWKGQKPNPNSCVVLNGHR